MQLIWDSIINLTDYAGNPVPKKVEKLLIGNEPTNDIFQYYIHGALSGSKGAHVALSNYATLAWEEAKQSLTSQRVRNIGLKTFPQLGAYGFYMPLYEDTGKLIVPIHNHSSKSVAPSMSVTQQEDTITFIITPPDATAYTCYRIIMRNGYFANEYITYETTLTIAKPAAGSYATYCVGYTEEGGITSEDSQSTVITVENQVQAASTSVIQSISFDAQGHIIITLADGSVITSTNTVSEVGQ